MIMLWLLPLPNSTGDTAAAAVSPCFSAPLVTEGCVSSTGSNKCPLMEEREKKKKEGKDKLVSLCSVNKPKPVSLKCQHEQ